MRYLHSFLLGPFLLLLLVLLGSLGQVGVIGQFVEKGRHHGVAVHLLLKHTNRFNHPGWDGGVFLLGDTTVLTDAN